MLYRLGILAIGISMGLATSFCAGCKRQAGQETGGNAAATRGGQTTAPAVDAPAAAIDMTNRLKFKPDHVTIRVGDELLWKNSSGIEHTVTCDPAKALKKGDVQLPSGAKPFSSPSISPSETYRQRFTVPGTYRYVCIPHEGDGMIATIEVKPR